jgi:hypothetical protein
VLDLGNGVARELAGCDLVLLRPDLHVAWRGNRVADDAGRISAVATGWSPPRAA